MSKILVTGAAGFIGSSLCERLLKSGREVIGLDNFNDFYDPRMKRGNLREALKSSNFRLIEGDILDTELMTKVFTENAISEIVHLAAYGGVRYSIKHPFLYEEVNVKGTIAMLELAKESNVDYFVHASSSAVYGLTKAIPFKETAGDLRPISPYGASKLSNEHYCFTYHHLFGLKCTALRFFTVYGPRQSPRMAIHKFMRAVHTGEELPFYGDGTSSRDYTYIEDIIKGIVAVLDRRYPFEVFNLGDSKPVGLRELVNLIEKTVAKKANIKEFPDQPGDVPITFADISKSKELLGYSPEVKIEDGILRFYDWFRSALSDPESGVE